MEWEKSKEDVCPICNEPTFYLVDEGQNLAEGCKRCRWVVDFTADEIEAQRVSDITKFEPSWKMSDLEDD